MVQNRKRRIASVGTVVMLAAFLFGSIFSDTFHRSGKSRANGRTYVAVIAKSTTSDYWKSAFAGARAAGTEYNLNVMTEGPESEEDCEMQNEMIAQAVEAGAGVIVLSAVDYHVNASAVEAAAFAGVKIVVIDSDVDSDAVSCRISTDNYQAGQLMGQAVLESVNQDLYIGIVNFDENTANGQQRERGFRDTVRGNERVLITSTINVRSDIEDSRQRTKDMLGQYPQINVLITFNEWTSLGVGYAIQDLGLADETMVIAFDSNVISVGMLETGEVDALVVQNPYAMGYLGVECAYNLMQGYPLKKTRIDTSTILVTRENMFDEECQRALFSFD